MKKILALSVVGAAALAAGTASAATIQLGGGTLTGNFGNAAAQGLNSSSDFLFNAASGGTSVSGRVQAANFGSSLFLTLTDLDFTTTSTSSVTLTVRIIADFVLAPTAIQATASHQINGNTAGSVVGATVQKDSLHESTNLAQLFVGPITGSGNILINDGSGAAVPVPFAGSIYTIDTLYTFTLARGTASASGSIVLPNSGVDQVTLTVIPLPPATYAGLGSLAILGAGAFVRRRRLSRSAV